MRARTHLKLSARRAPDDEVPLKDVRLRVEEGCAPRAEALHARCSASTTRSTRRSRCLGHAACRHTQACRHAGMQQEAACSAQQESRGAGRHVCVPPELRSPCPLPSYLQRLGNELLARCPWLLQLLDLLQDALHAGRLRVPPRLRAGAALRHGPAQAWVAGLLQQTGAVWFFCVCVRAREARECVPTHWPAQPLAHCLHHHHHTAHLGPQATRTRVLPRTRPARSCPNARAPRAAAAIEHGPCPSPRMSSSPGRRGSKPSRPTAQVGAPPADLRACPCARHACLLVPPSRQAAAPEGEGGTAAAAAAGAGAAGRCGEARRGRARSMRAPAAAWQLLHAPRIPHTHHAVACAHRGRRQPRRGGCRRLKPKSRCVRTTPHHTRPLPQLACGQWGGALQRLQPPPAAYRLQTSSPRYLVVAHLRARRCPPQAQRQREEETEHNRGVWFQAELQAVDADDEALAAKAKRHKDKARPVHPRTHARGRAVCGHSPRPGRLRVTRPHAVRAADRTPRLGQHAADGHGRLQERGAAV